MACRVDGGGGSNYPPIGCLPQITALRAGRGEIDHDGPRDRCAVVRGADAAVPQRAALVTAWTVPQGEKGDINLGAYMQCRGDPAPPRAPNPRANSLGSSD